MRFLQHIRFGRWILILLLVGVVPAASAQRSGEIRTLGRVAFINVNVIDVEKERILPKRTVYIERGRIKTIRKAGETLPADTFSIDGANKYLIPGLADMHVHHTGSGAFVKGTEPQLYSDRDLLLYLANGITTVRNMAGTSADAKIKRKLVEGEIVGPHYYSSGPAMISVDRGLFINTPQRAMEVIIAQKQAGYDFVKVYCCFGDKKEIYDQILRSSEENGIPAVGHVQLRLPLEEAFKLRSIEHLEHLPRYFNDEPPDIESHREVIKKIVDSKTVVCPTLTPFELFKLLDEAARTAYFARPEMAFIPESTFVEEMNAVKQNKSRLTDEKNAASIRKMHELGMQYVYFLHKQGVPLILGSDTGAIFPLVPGFTIHGELELLNQAGLSPMDALRSGTINVAKFLGNWETRGSIAENKESDDVLLDENPMVNISNTRKISGVMIGSKWIDKKAIEQILISLRKR